MKWKPAIQESLDELMKLAEEGPLKDDLAEDPVVQKLEEERERVRNQIEETENVIETLNNSISRLEEDRKKKKVAINKKKAELEKITNDLRKLKEENKHVSQQVRRYSERKARARSDFSSEDVAAVENVTMKLRAVCTLTGVYFDSSKRSVSDGYVANCATRQVEFFNVEGLPRNEAANKIWEAIHATTADQIK